jgi:hypothetical protein
MQAPGAIEIPYDSWMMAGRDPFLAVVDTMVLRNDLRRVLRLGRPTWILHAPDLGSSRLFVPTSVYSEMLEHLDVFVAGIPTPGTDGRAVWRERYEPRLWVVDIDPDEDDELVRWTLQRHPDDAPTMTLARLLGATLFSKNIRHLPLATEEWVPVLEAMAALPAAEAQLTAITTLPELAVRTMAVAGVALVWGITRLPPPIAFLLGVTVGLTATRYALGPGRSQWERLRPELGRMAIFLRDEFQRQSESKEAAERIVSPTLIPPAEGLGLRGNVARALARRPLMTAEEITVILRARDVEHGRDLPTRIRSLARSDPMFHEPHRGHFTLGRLASSAR